MAPPADTVTASPDATSPFFHPTAPRGSFIGGGTLSAAYPSAVRACMSKLEHRLTPARLPARTHGRAASLWGTGAQFVGVDDVTAPTPFVLPGRKPVGSPSILGSRDRRRRSVSTELFSGAMSLSSLSLVDPPVPITITPGAHGDTRTQSAAGSRDVVSKRGSKLLSLTGDTEAQRIAAFVQGIVLDEGTREGKFRTRFLREDVRVLLPLPLLCGLHCGSSAMVHLAFVGFQQYNCHLPVVVCVCPCSFRCNCVQRGLSQSPWVCPVPPRPKSPRRKRPQKSPSGSWTICSRTLWTRTSDCMCAVVRCIPSSRTCVCLQGHVQFPAR